MSDTLSSDQWGTLIDAHTDEMLGGARPGELPDVIAESDMVDADQDAANEMLNQAVDAGVLAIEGSGLAEYVTIDESGAPDAEDETTTEYPDVDHDDVRDHYVRLDELYAELGTIDGDTLAAGVTGRKGWYKRRKPEGEWDGEGRQTTLARDYDTLRENLEWVDNRSIHATVQYSKADRYADSWTPFNWKDGDASGRNWKGSDSATLGYVDIEAYAPFADIDLEDNVKENRPDGDIPQAEIEQAIEEYIAAFAKLAGGVEHVYALDSVGGSYVMASPTCTRPIADAFGPDGRERVFKELRVRLDKWLGEVRDNVNDAVPAVEGVFEPDLLNQKNRNYKAPMAVHKSLDGVVTPLDTESPTYEFTHLTDADSELIDDATEWAAGFTDEHDDAVASIVATLWPDEYAEAAGWESALRAWIESERAEEQAKEERRKRNKIRREDRLNELGTTVTGQSITPHIDDIFAAVDAVDVKGLVRNHCAEWEPTPAHRTNHFNPGSALWKESDSGTSCFVNTTKNIFVDTGDNGGEGGAAKFMALKESAISWPKDDHSGEPFWIGVEALRRDGYEIPVYIPGVNTTKSNGETYEKTPHRALRKAALLFGVVDTEDAFITKSGESGFYKTLAGKHRKETLDKLEEHGIEHGWDRRDDQADPSFEEMGVEENPETVDENIERFVANLKMM